MINELSAVFAPIDEPLDFQEGGSNLDTGAPADRNILDDLDIASENFSKDLENTTFEQRSPSY